jgi:hypothetical protein
MDAKTQSLRSEPGAIGDTARAYATSFARYVTEKTDNLNNFNSAFLITLMHRALVFEQTGNTTGNLLLPIHTKGVDEVHRLFDLVNQNNDIKYKLDLPTMILYSMLLESASYREGFAGMINGDIQIALGIIHQEIKEICPYQVLIGEDDFIYFNSMVSQSFLIKVDWSLALKIGAKLGV